MLGLWRGRAQKKGLPNKPLENKGRKRQWSGVGGTIPFLVQHGCTLSFKDAVLVAGEHELPCQLQTGEEAIQAVRVAETVTRGPVGERVLRVQVESRTDLRSLG